MCDQSLFIFDEVDKMPEGVLDAVKPYLDHHHHISGVDYRRTIFIFLRYKIQCKCELTCWGWGLGVESPYTLTAPCSSNFLPLLAGSVVRYLKSERR